MLNIPNDLKDTLKADFPSEIGKVVKEEKSSDGTIKYLFEFEGGHKIESVLLLMKAQEKNEKGLITQVFF